MKKVKSSSFKLNPIAASIVLAMATQLSANVALANGSYGTNTDISGATINVPTFYANSPQGIQPALDLVTHTYSTTGATIDTGTPLRKFVDPLAGVDGAGIPLAITEKWFNPLTNTQTSDDYYEIGIVSYTQQMHSDLPKATTLRGYVQIETPAIAAGLKDAAGVGSEHIPATYPDGTPIVDAKGQPVFWVHKPHYLGPIIVASRGTAVRTKYTNYLPYNDATGKPVGAPNGGELPLPVDGTIAGGANGVDANGKPVTFSQNRAEIHWHGGDTPWISDGTPHQWVAPAGEAAAWAAGIGKGASFQNVPDMPDPGPGSGTLYFPNNLSARLMFYHDHTSGLTKLNVYAGEAAGYVVVDPVEQGLVKSGVIPNTLLGVGIPLVIQDKTFVPKNIGPNAVASDGTPHSQDAKWDTTHWGQPGDLWFPHVYEANQDPNSIDGTNPVGRWDWGPWFWPVFPAQYSLPSGAYGDAIATPEAFMDTPVVNGQAYPTLTVEPKAYRFRILSVPNDRSMNYGLYQAVDAYVDPLTKLPAPRVCDANTVPAMAPAIPGGTAPVACTEISMVPAAPTPGFPADWPTDGRAGGVPDPATAGPDIIQIGNEAGLLPAPAIWHTQPIVYDQNVRSFTLNNVLKHDLLLMPAERADVIIDFSQYAGKTLILYNDAPAPMPGFDPRVDYFTGAGDQTGGGGAYDTMPGYGPNTRTIMQFKVGTAIAGGTGPAAPFNVAALQAALPVAYAASQPTPVVPESAYNAAFGTTDGDNFAQIYTGANAQPNFQWTPTGIQTIGALDAAGIRIANSGVTVVTGGSGFTTAPTVVFTGGVDLTVPGNRAATATATIDPALHKIIGIAVTDPGAGYTAPPTVSVVGGGGRGATFTVQTSATITKHVINKAIQELFNPVYGNMNATLAVELPFSTALTATTIPLSYIDTPVDYFDGIKDGETQIWKITHNGVDSHPVHFHMVNVQVINRVDWTGVVKPPQANELGWKETIRMDPLEDVVIAVKAVHTITPFGLPASKRPLDPSQALGSQLGFTQIDPMNGQKPAKPYSNVIADFDNEYVWHCHILGHEENDFMRPFIFHPNVVVPDAPIGVTLVGATLAWADPTPFGGVDAAGVPTAGFVPGSKNLTSNPKNEIGFQVQRSSDGGVTFATVATVPANTTTWTDANQVAGTTYNYQVLAYNAAGATPSSIVPIPASLAATGLAGVASFSVPAPVPASIADTTVNLTWAAFSTPNSGYNVYRNGVLLNKPVTTTTTTVVGNATTNTVTTAAAPVTATSFADKPVNEGATYSYQVYALGLPVTTTKTTKTTTGRGATLRTVTTITTTTTYPEIKPAATVSVLAPSSVPLDPTNFSATGSLVIPVATLSWTDNAFNETGYVVQRQDSTTGAACPGVGAWTTLATTPADTNGYIDTTGAYAASYCYQVAASNKAGLSNWAFKPVAVSMPGAPAPAAAVAPSAAPTGLSLTLNPDGSMTVGWNEVIGATGYIVSINGVALPVVLAPTTAYIIPATMGPAVNSNITVAAVTATGTSAAANLAFAAAKPPVVFAATPGTAPGSITLTWANDPLNVNNVSNFTLSWVQGATPTSKQFVPTSQGVTVTGLTTGTAYSFSIQAMGAVGNSVVTTTLPVTAP